MKVSVSVTMTEQWKSNSRDAESADIFHVGIRVPDIHQAMEERRFAWPHVDRSC